jgi:hypothetical protein
MAKRGIWMAIAAGVAVEDRIAVEKLVFGFVNEVNFLGGER